MYEDNLFDGSLLSAMDRYKAELLAAADDLHLRVAATGALGDVLTADVIAFGRAIILSIDTRNQNPIYPPLFLTFLEYRDWVVPTDRALCRMRLALAKTPKVYREFVRYAARQPMGGLFELNIFAALDDAFPRAEPQPKLPGSMKRADVRIEIDARPVYVEATVLGEAQYWANQRAAHQAAGQTMWVAGGPGPQHGARRVVTKIAEELAQTAADQPNILCLSFFDWNPTPPARQWAIDDAWTGGREFGRRADGTVHDLSRLRRVDSIFVFGRNAFLSVHANPNADRNSRLSDGTRDRIRNALAGPLMIR